MQVGRCLHLLFPQQMESWLISFFARIANHTLTYILRLWASWFPSGIWHGVVAAGPQGGPCIEEG